MGAAVATDREPRSHRPVASPPGRPVVRRRNGPRSARRRLTLPRSAEGSTIAVAGRASGIQGVSGSRVSQIPRAQTFRTIGGYTDTLIAPTAGGPAGHVPSRSGPKSAHLASDPLFAISAHQVLARSLLTAGSMQKSQSEPPRCWIHEQAAPSPPPDPTRDTAPSIEKRQQGAHCCRLSPAARR